METHSYKTFTIKVPEVHPVDTLKNIVSRSTNYLMAFMSSLRNRSTSLSPRISFSNRLPNLSERFKNINSKKVLPVLILLVTAGVTVFAVSKLLTKVRSNSANSARVAVAGAKATSNLNKEFAFPLKDSKGKKITDIKFVLESAELRDEIIVKGKRATAIQGRTFLILTVKITNDYTKSLEINSKDYFRLTANNNEKDLLAPEIHNDPVVVQPTSTKYTRIGWPINDTDKSLTLLVGEIEGEKSKVELNLQ